MSDLNPAKQAAAAVIETDPWRVKNLRSEADRKRLAREVVAAVEPHLTPDPEPTPPAETSEIEDDRITLLTVETLLRGLDAYVNEEGDIVLSESGAFLFYDADCPGQRGGSWKVRTR